MFLFLVLYGLILRFGILNCFRLKTFETLLSLSFFITCDSLLHHPRILLGKFFDSFKIKIQRFIRKIISIERKSLCFHLDLQWHLSVVQEPVFSVERNVIEPLDVGKIDANIELTLEFTC
jgi:hypothetical protein